MSGTALRWAALGLRRLVIQNHIGTDSIRLSDLRVWVDCVQIDTASLRWFVYRYIYKCNNSQMYRTLFKTSTLPTSKKCRKNLNSWDIIRIDNHRPVLHRVSSLTFERYENFELTSAISKLNICWYASLMCSASCRTTVLQRDREKDGIQGQQRDKQY